MHSESESNFYTPENSQHNCKKEDIISPEDVQPELPQECYKEETKVFEEAMIRFEEKKTKVLKKKISKKKKKSCGKKRCKKKNWKNVKEQFNCDGGKPI